MQSNMPGRRHRPSRIGARGAALLLSMAGALVAAPAAAMQVLDAVDHAELTAVVSATSVSRIALAHDRIARVIRSPGGFETEHDPGSGDLYLRPLGAGHAGSNATGGALGGAPGDAVDDAVEAAPAPAPMALFIGTEKGFTYRLTLAVAARGSAQILIRNAAASNPVWTGKSPDGKAAAGDPPHQRQGLRALPLRLVVERRASDRQQAALPAQAQRRVIADHHRAALRPAHRPDPRDKKSRSTISSPILA